jgi:hypothetical protein
MRRRVAFALVALSLVLLGAASPSPTSSSTGPLVQIHQDFSADPHWEAYHNRVVAENPPTKKQDFGWSGNGRIGGTIWVSRTPAWYAMPIGRPLSFKDSFSASGRISLRSIGGSAYFGFFNSTRQEWRPWSSIAIRLADSKRGAALAGNKTPGAQLWVDYMSATWKAGYMVLDDFVPADGSAHAWKFAYDADARPDAHWPDASLAKLFRDRSRLAEDEIVATLGPGIRMSLAKARDQGLLEYDPRHDKSFWELKRDLDRVRGRVMFQLDDAPPVYYFLDPGVRDEPTVLDRFGIFNYQIPEGSASEFYLSDLVVNGQPIAPERDPNWQGVGNRVSFVERDFHPGHNFGFSQTNWAGGERMGEVGGLFWRNEPVDPYHGFYADDVGELTLDDAISVSGTIAFVNGGTDASMMFGYFNRADRLASPKVPDAEKKSKLPMLGIRLADQTSDGYRFQPFVNTPAGSANKNGPQFVPDRRPRKFSFDYDPTANDGVGRIVSRLDDKETVVNLKRDMRNSGVRFDRFGLLTVRSGGKYVEVYLDDLTYTARRAKDAPPKRFEETITKVPYPPRGRMY